MDWQLVASYFTVKSTDIFFSVLYEVMLKLVNNEVAKAMTKGKHTYISAYVRTCVRA